VPDINSNSNKKNIAENSKKRNFKRCRFVTKDDPLGRGKILISSFALKKVPKPEGWNKNFAKCGVALDGEIFINPGLLSPWAGIFVLIDQVVLAIEGVPILAPLSWAEANYSSYAEILKDLQMKIRKSVASVFIFPDENASQVAAKESHANGN
jgi:hypothetical protein